MARVNETKMIEFTEGELAGQKAYVTFEEGDDYLRVTPVKGDQLCSIELSRKRGGFRGLPSNTIFRTGSIDPIPVGADDRRYLGAAEPVVNDICINHFFQGYADPETGKTWMKCYYCGAVSDQH